MNEQTPKAYIDFDEIPGLTGNLTENAFRGHSVYEINSISGEGRFVFRPYGDMSVRLKSGIVVRKEDKRLMLVHPDEISLSLKDGIYTFHYINSDHFLDTPEDAFARVHFRDISEHGIQWVERDDVLKTYVIPCNIEAIFRYDPENDAQRDLDASLIKPELRNNLHESLSHNAPGEQENMHLVERRVI